MNPHFPEIKKLAKEGYDENACAPMAVQAASCVECGACEGVCPQKLHIRKLLKEAAKALA